MGAQDPTVAPEVLILFSRIRWSRRPLEIEAGTENGRTTKVCGKSDAGRGASDWAQHNELGAAKALVLRSLSLPN